MIKWEQPFITYGLQTMSNVIIDIVATGSHAPYGGQASVATILLLYSGIHCTHLDWNGHVFHANRSSKRVVANLIKTHWP